MLLAQTLKAENKELAASLRKFYEAKQDSLPVDAKAFDRLFRTVLATKAMDDAPSLQESVARKQYNTMRMPPMPGCAAPMPAPMPGGAPPQRHEMSQMAYRGGGGGGMYGAMNGAPLPGGAVPRE